MAYYAFLDENNIVTEVIPGKSGLIDGIPADQWYAEYRGQKCVLTSYNGLVHGYYAGIGYYYDETTEQFVPPILPEPEPPTVE